jgi:hypothetical protein
VLGLDNWIASFSDGTTVLVVALVAVLLGLRHATDPDHLAAVTTLIAGTEESATEAAARLGLSWGLGHATSLFLFGVPIVLFKAYLPARAGRCRHSASASSTGRAAAPASGSSCSRRSTTRRSRSSRWRAGALAIFALCSALSMALLSTGFGRALASTPLCGSFDRLAPALALASLSFGAWYALGALDLAPYFF